MNLCHTHELMKRQKKACQRLMPRQGVQRGAALAPVLS